MKYLIAGILGGALGGMGMGGGTLLIPLLLYLGVGQHSAQSINLISFVPMSLIAVYMHAKKGLIKYKYLRSVALPATITACLSACLSVCLSGEVLKRAFGLFLVFVGLRQLLTVIKANTAGRKRIYIIERRAE